MQGVPRYVDGRVKPDHDGGEKAEDKEKPGIAGLSCIQGQSALIRTSAGGGAVRFRGNR
jgi:hypothetical protein